MNVLQFGFGCLLACMLFISTKAECELTNQGDATSKNILKRLDPLKDMTFTSKFVDKVTSDQYMYTLTICKGVSIKGFNDDSTGVVQQDLQTEHFKKVGLINYTSVKSGTDWIMLTYSHGDKYRSHCSKGMRQAHIMIVCDPNAKAGEFKVLYEHNDENNASECFYMMELPSIVACNSLQHGLSSGSIFLIVFFTVTLAYLMFGAIYKRCVYGSKGWDQIPNVGFWKTFGSLQADGCNYLCRCHDSGYDSSKPYQGIADDQLDEEIDDEHLLPM